MTNIRIARSEGGKKRKKNYNGTRSIIGHLPQQKCFQIFNNNNDFSTTTMFSDIQQPQWFQIFNNNNVFMKTTTMFSEERTRKKLCNIALYQKTLCPFEQNGLKTRGARKCTRSMAIRANFSEFLPVPMQTGRQWRGTCHLYIRIHGGRVTYI